MLGHIQEREEKCIRRTVVAGPDIALLADEKKQGAQGQEYAHGHQRIEEHGSVEVAIQRIHAVFAWRKTRYNPRPKMMRCTHHTPMMGASLPLPIHTLAADNRFEYTK